MAFMLCVPILPQYESSQEEERFLNQVQLFTEKVWEKVNQKMCNPWGK